MDQLIFASLSHTHYWYEMGMLKVSAVKYGASYVFASGWWFFTLYVCMVNHIARVWVNRVRLPILLVVS